MKSSNIPLAQAVVQACMYYKIEHIIISPGSRNAPLTLSFAHHPSFQCLSVVDERSAAFFALGVAQQTQKPVALVCTSGSALLNYYPAIAEAYYSQIPLIVLSADRPQCLIDLGDGQTIRQRNVYGTHVGFAAHLEENPDLMQENIEKLSLAFHAAWLQKLPVHLNVPFDEPLYGTTDKIENFDFLPLAESAEKTQVDVTEFEKNWQKSQKIMVLAGTLYPDEIEQEATQLLAKDPRISVLTETTSNWHHSSFINSIDKLIAPLKPEDLESLQPDLLLTVGGQIVSKKIKALLRKNKKLVHYHLGHTPALDTFFHLKGHLEINMSSFFKTHTDVNSSSDYKRKWLHFKALHAEKHSAYTNKIPFSDFKSFELIFKYLPENIHLQLSNSATVRYSQLFDLPAKIHVYCNRGTSGIDGSTSTAVGAAYIHPRKTVFITGDLSFFYDSNAFWNAYVKKDFLAIVINNGGGGIFRILPGAENSPVFEKYFETLHHREAKNTAETFGFNYFCANNETTLCEALKQSFSSSNNRPCLLEVFTPRLINDKILTEYFIFLGK